MNRIKEVLEEKGIKQTWLADKLSKSYNMVNSYVQNRRQPSIKDLFKIAAILCVEAKDLLIKTENTLRKKEGYESQFLQYDSHEFEPSLVKTEKIPILGNVACGTPILAEENIEATISVSTKLIKPHQNYFLLRASGDSMNDAGIDDGDLVLIRQQHTAQKGEIVVALIDDEATIKEYHHLGNKIVLKPNSKNSIHKPIILTSDFRIQGVVETVIPIKNI